MAICVDEAVRAGYGFETVMGMSPIQVFEISKLAERRRRMDMKSEATTVRVGTNANEKQWTDFMDRLDE